MNNKGWVLKPEDLQVTVETIRKSGITVDVKNVDSIPQLEKTLDAIPPNTLVWANAYYVNDGKGGVAWLNDYIVERNLPLIGSSSQALLYLLEKDVCQTILQDANIPVPPFIVITRETVDNLENIIETSGHTFPMVIKPTTEGGSLGIELVHNQTGLSKQAHYILDNFPESNVIIETFLPSDDITCGYLQVGNDILLMPSYYIVKNAPGKAHVLTRENQFRPWDDKNKMQFCVEEQAIIDQLKVNIPKIVNTLGILDVTRIDGRLNSQGELCFFDINGFPGLRFSKSVLTRQCALYFPTYSDIDIYAGLLNTIICGALVRYGFEVPEALQKHNLFTMKSDKAIKISAASRTS